MRLKDSYYFIWLVIIFSCSGLPGEKLRPPNFIIIFTDDQGYGDLSCFGALHVSTPQIDQMAAEGAKLTSFYVAASVCSPSRAALLTGCYPKRIDMCRGAILSGDNYFPVMLAGDPKGLNPMEITIAELLKTQGYATAIFGKWHLGDQPEFLPTRQGFDEFFGIPYSHDIHSFHPRQNHFNFPRLPLLENEKVVEMDPNADLFTQRFTDRAIDFIERNKENPFLIYLPHPIPHNPLHASKEFLTNISDSIRNRLDLEDDFIDYRARDHLYPHVIREIDWSVGKILNYLRKHNLAENTLVLFTTDNGPGSRMASSGPLRGRKGTPFEGGLRVPAVVWWPGRIEAGQEISTLVTAMDLYPTFAGLAGAVLPVDRTIDGRDIWPILSDRNISESPHDRFFYYHIDELKAVRSGPWKFHRHLHGLKDSLSALYNLEEDPGEQKDVSSDHPEVVERLSRYLYEHEVELGNGPNLTKHCRPAGRVANAIPLQL